MTTKKKEILGKKLHKLLVLEELYIPYKGNHPYRKRVAKLKCQCECGSIIEVFRTNLLSGRTTKCTFCQNSKIKLGEKYGNLTVSHRSINETRRYICVCECGNESSIKAHYLLKGKSPQKCERCRHPKKYRGTMSWEENMERLRESAYVRHQEFRKIIEGKKINKIKVIKFSHWTRRGKKSNWRKSHFLCRCLICNKNFTCRSDYLLKKQSCGCQRYKNMAISWQRALTSEEASMIRELFRLKIYTQRKIAEMFNIGETIISDIVLDKTYKK